MATPGTAYALYPGSNSAPYSTSTILLPAGYELASTGPGGMIFYTNSGGTVSSMVDTALVAAGNPTIVASLPTPTTVAASVSAPTTPSAASDNSASSITTTTTSQRSTSISPTVSTSRSEVTSTSSNLGVTTTTGSATNSTSHPNIPSSNGRLPNGTVAGIVVGVAVGLAFVTFLATFFLMRHKPKSGGKTRHQNSKSAGAFAAGSIDQQSRSPEPKGPVVTETYNTSGSSETFLPQSADDKTVQNIAKTTLDQIELHVENFYQGIARSSMGPTDADFATFNSPYLSDSLGTLLSQTRNAVPLIKHALAHFITDSISLIANPESTLLPDEFILLPSTVKAANTNGSARPGKIIGSVRLLAADSIPGFSPCMSRWRVLTAYLRPRPSQDPIYIAERDQRINEIVKVFSRAFAPWKSLKYSDDDRGRSLSAILKDAADLGLFIFEQPSDLQFQWSKQSEVGTNRIAIAPALFKLSDEKGNTLLEPQVMLKSVVQRT